MSRRVYRIPTENNSQYQMLDADEFHKEFPRPPVDGTPLAPPVGYKRQDPLHVRLRAMLMEHAADQERDYVETPEEADDFDVDDDDGHLPIAGAELNYLASQLPPDATSEPAKPPAAEPAGGPPQPPQPAPAPEPKAP